MKNNTAKILAIILIFFLLLIALFRDIDLSVRESRRQDIVESPTIVEIQKDKQGRILSKQVYNKDTKLTYIYTYTYTSDEFRVYCDSAYVQIVDENGNILSSSVE